MTDPRESAAPTLAPPSRKKTAELRSLSVTGLFILAVFYTLHLARDLFLPIVLALFLTLLLQPPVRWLRRLRRRRFMMWSWRGRWWHRGDSRLDRSFLFHLAVRIRFGNGRRSNRPRFTSADEIRQFFTIRLG